jgi:hypothetical protein
VTRSGSLDGEAPHVQAHDVIDAAGVRAGLFALFDVDGDGRISWAEYQVRLRDNSWAGADKKLFKKLFDVAQPLLFLHVSAVNLTQFYRCP